MEINKVIQNSDIIVSNGFTRNLVKTFKKIGIKGSKHYFGNENSIFYDGYYIDGKYLDYVLSREYIKFNYDHLSEKDKDFLEMYREKNIISVHIRRGDYINNKTYNNICTLEYYKKAISIVNKTIDNPLFLIFSDDTLWVKQNLKIDNGFIADWNQGYNSYKDMLLMSKCNGHIIANSTFSFWAARLNDSQKITVYPQKWWNLPYKLDIFPDNWIGI